MKKEEQKKKEKANSGEHLYSDNSSGRPNSHAVEYLYM